MKVPPGIFRVLMIVALLVLREEKAAAQNRITFQVFGGMGLSNLYSKDATARFSPRILPHAGTYALIPLEDRFSLKTGLAYEQKGWKVHSSTTDTMENIRDEHTSAMRMHTVRIPMQLSYTFGNEKALSYTVSAGMSYVFFVQADATWLIDTYHEDRLLHSQTLQWNPTIALIPDESRFTSTYEGTQYFRFNTAFRAEAGITWKARYSMQVFWERGLNGISASFGNTTTLHLGYSGISLGVNLR